MTYRRCRRASQKKRRAAAVVEFAVVAPVFFVALFGIFEIGRLMMVQQIMVNAAREGARRAILEQSTVAEVEQTVSDYLVGAMINGATITVSPDPLRRAGFGDPVAVTVGVPFGNVSWLPAPWFASNDTNISGVSVMLAERPE